MAKYEDAYRSGSCRFCRAVRQSKKRKDISRARKQRSEELKQSFMLKLKERSNIQVGRFGNVKTVFFDAFELKLVALLCCETWKTKDF